MDKLQRDPEAQPDWNQPRPDFEAKNAARRQARQDRKRGGRQPRRKAKPPTGRGGRKGAAKMLKQPPRVTGESPEQHKSRLKSNAERFGKLARGG